MKKPFFIAEISTNHCGSLVIAKKLIKCAKINGADAVKLQTYSPETMTINSNKKHFKNSLYLYKQEISLPTYVGLSNKKLKFVISKIKNFFKD